VYCLVSLMYVALSTHTQTLSLIVGEAKYTYETRHDNVGGPVQPRLNLGGIEAREHDTKRVEQKCTTTSHPGL
jgi:hypothetical protein